MNAPNYVLIMSASHTSVIYMATMALSTFSFYGSLLGDKICLFCIYLMSKGKTILIMNVYKPKLHFPVSFIQPLIIWGILLKK